MNPEVKKIGNKLFDKVELESQKVELGLTQDIVAVLKQISSEMINAEKTINNLSSLKKQTDEQKVKAEESMKNLVSLYNKGLPIYDKIDKMSEELDVVVPNLGAWAQAFKDVEQEVSQIKMWIK
jgi:regulator of replication initiation timing